MVTLNNTSGGQERLKLQIMVTAMDAFTTNGIRSITMDSLARRMKISKRTLYEVFEDKETLLLECTRAHQQRMHEEMKAFSRKNDNVLEIILHFFESGMKELRQTNPQFHIDIKRYPRVLNEIRKQRKDEAENTVTFLMKGVEQGIFRNDVDFDILCKILSESFERAIRNTMSNVSTEQILRTILPVWIRGISTVKGQKILDNYLLTNRICDKRATNLNVYSFDHLKADK